MEKYEENYITVLEQERESVSDKSDEMNANFMNNENYLEYSLERTSTSDYIDITTNAEISTTITTTTTINNNTHTSSESSSPLDLKKKKCRRKRKSKQIIIIGTIIPTTTPTTTPTTIPTTTNIITNITTTSINNNNEISGKNSNSNTNELNGNLKKSEYIKNINNNNNNNNLLSLDIKRLNSQMELRKLFGIKLKNRCKQKKWTNNRTHIIIPKRKWPPLLKHAINMIIVDEPKSYESILRQLLMNYEHYDQIKWFHFEYNAYYRRVQDKFLSCFQNNDMPGISNIIRIYPYHVDAMLQLSEQFKLRNNYEIAADYIERAIFVLESALLSIFNLTDGYSFLDYRHPKNRSFFIVLFKHCIYLDYQTCHTTAFEIAKLIYNMNPFDPLAMILSLDYHALRSQQYKWLIDFYDKYEIIRDFSQFPNMVYSYALAWFYYRGQCDESNTALQNALLTFPNVLKSLINALKFNINIKHINDKYFNNETNNTNNEEQSILTLLISYYTKRSIIIWSQSDDIQIWLQSNINIILDRIKRDNNIDYRKYRFSKCSQPQRSILRHIFLYDGEENVYLRKFMITHEDFHLFDPFPPNNSLNYHNKKSLGTHEHLISIEENLSEFIFSTTLFSKQNKQQMPNILEQEITTEDFVIKLDKTNDIDSLVLNDLNKNTNDIISNAVNDNKIDDDINNNKNINDISNTDNSNIEDLFLYDLNKKKSINFIDIYERNKINKFININDDKNILLEMNLHNESEIIRENNSTIEINDNIEKDILFDDLLYRNFKAGLHFETNPNRNISNIINNKNNENNDDNNDEANNNILNTTFNIINNDENRSLENFDTDLITNTNDVIQIIENTEIITKTVNNGNIKDYDTDTDHKPININMHTTFSTTNATTIITNINADIENMSDCIGQDIMIDNNTINNFHKIIDNINIADGRMTFENVNIKSNEEIIINIKNDNDLILENINQNTINQEDKRNINNNAINNNEYMDDNDNINDDFNITNTNSTKFEYKNNNNSTFTIINSSDNSFDTDEVLEEFDSEINPININSTNSTHKTIDSNSNDNDSNDIITNLLKIEMENNNKDQITINNYEIIHDTQACQLINTIQNAEFSQDNHTEFNNMITNLIHNAVCTNKDNDSIIVDHGILKESIYKKSNENIIDNLITEDTNNVIEIDFNPNISSNIIRENMENNEHADCLDSIVNHKHVIVDISTSNTIMIDGSTVENKYAKIEKNIRANIKKSNANKRRLRPPITRFFKNITNIVWNFITKLHQRNMETTV